MTGQGEGAGIGAVFDAGDVPRAICGAFAGE